MSNTAQAARKTTKTQLREAVDSFLWKLDWVTGGTREETLRQADSAIVELESKAAQVMALAMNAGKIAAADSHLMEYATKLIPSRVQSYRASYVGKYESFKAEQAAKRAQEEKFDQTIQAPSNIIFHNFAA